MALPTPPFGVLTEKPGNGRIIPKIVSELRQGMMRFSSKEEFGLRAMAELASHYGEGPVPLSEVASSQGIALDTLEQIVAPLRRAGLLVSTRGASGGYELGHPPAEVTVADVLQALEGQLVPIPCLDEAPSRCERAKGCMARPVWALVRDRLVETLDHMTLADVCNQEIRS